MNSKNRHPWRPLLEGAQAEQARVLIEEAAETLHVDPVSFESPSLSDGAAGRAMFYAYLAEAWPDRGFGERAEKYLERAIDQLAEQPMREFFYGGFTGVAWVVEHLQGKFIGPDDEDPNLSLDEALRDHLGTTPWLGDYDLIVGLTGMGVYALERLPREIAVENLGRVVARLKETAEERDGGLTWLSRPELMLPQTREDNPNGYYNMGLAHGVPGVIALLAGACEAGVAVDDARPMLEGAWRWMMNNRLAPEAETTFTYWIRDGLTPNISRNAWCYGDPGAATAMYQAARVVGNTAWAEEALAIARRSAQRPAENCGAVDAGVCHGKGGLALIYNRLWQATAEQLFADAARSWYDLTIKAHQPGKGVAGWQSWVPRAFDKREAGWEDDAGFLTGAEGIALTLLAGISSVDPAWDRVLLTSLPPTS